MNELRKDIDPGTISCRNCGHEFQLSDALTGKIREQLRAEMQREVTRREAEVNERIAALKTQEEALTKSRAGVDQEVEAQLQKRLVDAKKDVEKRAASKYTEQLNELQETLKEREQAITTFREQERGLRKRQRELEESKASMDLEISRKLDEERDKLRQEAAGKLEAEHAAQLKELREALGERDASVKAFREQEVALRKKQREIQEAKDAFELELVRKLDEERGKIREEAGTQFAEAHRLKELEKDKVIADLKDSLDAMKRKAEQGSMETQGEVLEIDFENRLKTVFPHDEIVPVPKGIRGADLVQTVRTSVGVRAGILLWEAKNTKSWNAQWIPKLKDDMIETRAAVAILVSVVLPEDVERFGLVDGVWVSDTVSAIPLAAALREQLLAVAREQNASIGKNEKMEMLYQYLAGTEFRQKIEGIVEAFTAMQDQIARERRAMEKHWKQRTKEIERVIKNTVGLYGDMQGIIGGRIPIIPALELDPSDANQLPIISIDDD